MLSIVRLTVSCGLFWAAIVAAAQTAFQQAMADAAGQMALSLVCSVLCLLWASCVRSGKACQSIVQPWLCSCTVYSLAAGCLLIWIVHCIMQPDAGLQPWPPLQGVFSRTWLTLMAFRPSSPLDVYSVPLLHEFRFCRGSILLAFYAACRRFAAVCPSVDLSSTSADSIDWHIC